MSTTIVSSPISRVRFGVARVDITPPPNIYHRLWGRFGTIGRPVSTTRLRLR